MPPSADIIRRSGGAFGTPYLPYVGRLVGCLALCSCGLFPSLDDLAGDAATVGGDATVDATAGDATVDATAGDATPGAECFGDAGPTPVLVGSYCIDSTEVTVAQYKQFLATKPALSLIAECSFKVTHAPDITPPNGHDDYPITSIDWCDAHDYCVWAGKYLCGNVSGGSLQSALVSKPQDAWFTACARNGAYSYGGTYDPSACNGPERDAGPLPAALLPKCVGGVPPIANMVGNADEWFDSCTRVGDGGAVTDQCGRHSGSFSDPAGSLQVCAFNRTGSRNTADSDIGFRCCSDKR